SAMPATECRSRASTSRAPAPTPGAASRASPARTPPASSSRTCSAAAAPRRGSAVCLAAEQAAQETAQIRRTALAAGAAQPAEDAAEQAAQVRTGVRGGLVDAAGRRRPVRREQVDDRRQECREERQQLADRDAVAGGKLLDLLVAERRAELLRRHRLVRSGADPRIDLRSQAGRPELVEEAVDAALLADRGGEGGDGAGRIGRGRAAGRAGLTGTQLVEHPIEIVHASRPPALRLGSRWRSDPTRGGVEGPLGRRTGRVGGVSARGARRAARTWSGTCGGSVSSRSGARCPARMATAPRTIRPSRRPGGSPRPAAGRASGHPARRSFAASGPPPRDDAWRT